MELMEQLETGGIQSDEHGGKEFRSSNETIMEVYAARLMAQLENSCLAGTSPLGRTSMTQEFDGQLAALELACAK
ncbi:hypothetical protein GCK72_003652 [Caenorhabditis remanei]|uniref:Uncharacterized protein n=1 Tax=Caenorhabditis remanei TaxID=31234 RepID=A0A6A5H8Z3_CAERE|nr:hypothetical protein GCK72_003652 [Caenorhabditis remanei]KAF1763707.1 hypothetical protein GCK72_003652 [Caenorhabditis remanei]